LDIRGSGKKIDGDCIRRTSEKYIDAAKYLRVWVRNTTILVSVPCSFNVLNVSLTKSNSRFRSTISSKRSYFLGFVLLANNPNFDRTAMTTYSDLRSSTRVASRTSKRYSKSDKQRFSPALVCSEFLHLIAIHIRSSRPEMTVPGNARAALTLAIVNLFLIDSPRIRRKDPPAPLTGKL